MPDSNRTVLVERATQLVEATRQGVSRLGAYRFYGPLLGDDPAEAVTQREAVEVLTTALFVTAVAEDAIPIGEAGVAALADFAGEALEHLSVLTQMDGPTLPLALYSGLNYAAAHKLANAKLMMAEGRNGAAVRPDRWIVHQWLIDCLRDLLLMNFARLRQTADLRARTDELRAVLETSPQLYESVAASSLALDAIRAMATYVLEGSEANLALARSRLAQARRLSLSDSMVAEIVSHTHAVVEEYADSYTPKILRSIESPLPNEYIRTLIESKNPVFFLWPSQRAALEQGLLREQRCAISMPTSAGKTLLAEMKIAEVLSRHQEGVAIYVVPLNALAKQIQSTLQQRLRPAPLRMNIRVLTGQYDIGDEEMKLAGRQENVVITTPEKLDGLLRNSDREEIAALLQRCKLFIFDECQQLGASKRGVTYEFLIARVMDSHPDADILALSAVFSNIDSFARWLGGLPIRDTWRPTKTYSGVWEKEGNLIYDNRWRMEGVERTDDTKGDVAQLAISLQRMYENVLVLASSKDEAERFARRIASELVKSNATVTNAKEQQRLRAFATAVRALIHHESALADLIETGVAYHHRNVPADLKSQIEDFVASGTLKFVCSTTTLAQGLNFPIRCVIIPSIYIQGEAMPPPDLMNIVGRAGRANVSTSGQVVVLKNWKRVRFKDRLVNFEDYCFHPSDDLLTVHSALASLVDEPDSPAFDQLERREALDSQLLAILGQEDKWNDDQVENIADKTLLVRSSAEKRDAFSEVIRGRLTRMAEGEAPLVRAASPFTLTPYGRMVRRTGMGSTNADHLRRELERVFGINASYLASLRSQAALDSSRVRLLLRLALSAPRNILDTNAMRTSAKALLGQSRTDLRKDFGPALDAVWDMGDLRQDVVDALEAHDVEHAWRWINGAEHLDLASFFLGKSKTNEAVDRAIMDSMHACEQLGFELAWVTFAVREYVKHLYQAGREIKVSPEVDNLAHYMKHGVNTPGAVVLIETFKVPRRAAIAIGSRAEPVYSLQEDRIAVWRELSTLDEAIFHDAIANEELAAKVVSGLSTSDLEGGPADRS